MARWTVQLDFEELAALAVQDPAGFERLRREAIEEVIADAPAEQRERLERLQWRVDQERSRAGTPLAACIAISRMMWERFSGLDGLLTQLNRPDVWRGYDASEAKVLRFRPRSHHY